ncbi:hypothetical protein [Streptacidiphilus jiangxiensis]|uniref:PH domain-containing protein n=1 Tax=Streptacidiphilus jiangxiensis TaxID=235985 RepID=A0A1H7YKP3_STRJI|nr:hypothetical protein [Streptacidiphilus jiangxiensis]SEM45868.1 hypothetical protein SAMN05414137_12912 [Streptacidiphilus jiangxiensis]
MRLTQLLAEAPHSAPVTHAGDLVGWVIGILLVIALVYWLMRQGWNWRKTVQSGLPEPAAVPSRTTEPILESEGRYVGSTTAGNWLDRVAAHRLGERSLVELTLSAEGLKVVRPASQSFFVPVADLRGARLDKGIAGKVFPEGGLLVITWQLGDQQLDSGFRADRSSEHDNWVTAIEVLITAHDKVTRTNDSKNDENVEGA